METLQGASVDNSRYTGPITAKEIVSAEFNSLRGRLCSVIESANLPSKQEKAIITLLKHLSYQNQSIISELVEQLNEDTLFEYIGNKLTGI